MIDPRLDTVLQAAASRVQGALSAALSNLARQWPTLTQASTHSASRQVLMDAEQALARHTLTLTQWFARDLGAALARVQASRGQATGKASASPMTDTDWASLSLVDDAEVERGVNADRLAQTLSADCEEPLAALQAHLGSLGLDVNGEANPLRPQSLARGLLTCLSELSLPTEVSEALAHHIGRVWGPELHAAYAHSVAEMRSRGIAAQGLVIQRSKGQQTGSGGLSVMVDPSSVHGSLQGELGQSSTRSGTWFDSQGSRHSGVGRNAPDPQAHSRAARALGQMFGMALPDTSGNAPLPMAMQAASADMATQVHHADFQNLLKRISQQSQASVWTAGLTDPAWPASNGAAWPQEAPPGVAAGFAGPLMAVNQIRAHRDELVQASGGAPLDQMVIDIVAALFDQVLSDPKVAPEMARQIARLQMPVLRVALSDMGFFSSRKHPVRRFVNRVATLSAAFDNHDAGLGRDCLARVTVLVHDIVQGDFDRMDLYEAKLAELEAFIEGSTPQEGPDHAAVMALLSGKEADLRVQQRYMQTLKRELADVDMPEFVREFLTQIWSQVQVMAAARDGEQSDRAQRMRKAGHELVVSVQPKGSPALRKAFLMGLPQLMRDLNEGLTLIQWPEEARQGFFAQLLPAHSECMKAPPQHDLTVRLIDQRLKQVERMGIPSREEAANDPLPASMGDLSSPPRLTVVSALSPDEIKAAGFVPEAAIPNAPLDEALASSPDTQPGADPSLDEIDINLDAPAPPSHGPQLLYHVQKGAAYNMLTQGEWKKVRLTWVSEGRAFFIFSHGQQHKATISLTARTLAKMCEGGRFKAFEQSELIERATLRARRQLAALGQTGKRSAA